MTLIRLPFPLSQAPDCVNCMQSTTENFRSIWRTLSSVEVPVDADAVEPCTCQFKLNDQVMQTCICYVPSKSCQSFTADNDETVFVYSGKQYYLDIHLDIVQQLCVCSKTTYV